MNTGSELFRAWDTMDDRAQGVWAAAYASSQTPGVEAARHADQVVASLEALEVPRIESPEHRAARYCIGLSLDEFRSWYLVEQKIHARRHGLRGNAASDTAVAEAFETYCRCTADFY